MSHRRHRRRDSGNIHSSYYVRVVVRVEIATRVVRWCRRRTVTRHELDGSSTSVPSKR